MPRLSASRSITMTGRRLQIPDLIYRLGVYVCVYPDKVLGQLALAQRNFPIPHTKFLLMEPSTGAAAVIYWLPPKTNQSPWWRRKLLNLPVLSLLLLHIRSPSQAKSRDLSLLVQQPLLRLCEGANAVCASLPGILTTRLSQT